MASRIVTLLLLEAAKPIVATIRKGKPVASVIGALVGAGLAGFAMYRVEPKLAPLCAAVGAIVGATTGAALFTRPTTSPGARATDLEPFRLGKVLRVATFVQGDFRSVTVLLENALYVVRVDKEPWEPVVERLKHGQDPDLPQGNLIRFDELVRIELASLDALEITLAYRVAGSIKRRLIDVQTTAVRDELVAIMEQQLGHTFARRECPLETSRAIRTPVILTAAVGVFFSLAAWLSAHWIAHPPRPPRGKPKGDELVLLLTWLGPGGVLLVGAVVLLAPLAWLASRVIWPPRIHVIQIQEEENPLRNDPV